MRDWLSSQLDGPSSWRAAFDAALHLTSSVDHRRIGELTHPLQSYSLHWNLPQHPSHQRAEHGIGGVGVLRDRFGEEFRGGAHAAQRLGALERATQGFAYLRPSARNRALPATPRTNRSAS